MIASRTIRAAGVTLLAAASAAIGGCAARGKLPAARATDAPAAAVVLRQYQPGGRVPPDCQVSLLDVDVASSQVRVRVVADGLEHRRGTTWGVARTVADWCSRYRAWGGVNGGYFGAQSADCKEIVGLLALNGAVRSRARLVQARGNADRFARSALWVGRDGLPRIGWTTAETGKPARLALHEGPVNPMVSRLVPAISAVGCGPTLIARGAERVTDREERLVSPLRRPRTFVAYSVAKGRPARFVMGVASAMTFREVAAFLAGYFVAEHRTPCEAAMCLDGGSSSQLAYLSQGRYVGTPGGIVTVPTAVLLLPAAR